MMRPGAQLAVRPQSNTPINETLHHSHCSVITNQQCTSWMKANTSKTVLQKNDKLTLF